MLEQTQPITPPTPANQHCPNCGDAPKKSVVHPRGDFESLFRGVFICPRQHLWQVDWMDERA